MLGEISGDFLQWLRGFYYVAMEGSVWQAAIAMGREKPTISRQIQCLEKELGVTLFDRSSRRMIITPEGEKLLEGTVTLFENVNQIKGEFTQEGIKYRGEIYIAATPAIIYYILPPYIDHFQKLHPEITFRLEAVAKRIIYEKVESTEADFGIGSYETGHKTLLFHNLYEAGTIMIAPKNNAFFPPGAVPTLKQIAEAPLMLISHQGSPKPLIKDRFAKDRLKPNITIVHNNHVALKYYVAQGMGVAIMAEHTISAGDEQIFDIYSLDQYFTKKNYGILLKKKKYLPARVKAFLRIVSPDIEFSNGPRTSEERPALSLPEFHRRGAALHPAEAKKTKAAEGKARKRSSAKRLPSSLPELHTAGDRERL